MRGVRSRRTAPSSQLPSHKLIARREKLLGRLVALVMGAVGFKAHAAGAAVEIAGNDIPADPPAGEVIERREAARQLVGVFVGEVGRDAEAEMFCHQRHRGDQQGRLGVGQLNGVTQRGLRAVAVDVVDAEHVGEEDAVEQAAFGRPGIIHPIVECVVVEWRCRADATTSRPSCGSAPSC